MTVFVQYVPPVLDDAQLISVANLYGTYSIRPGTPLPTELSKYIEWAVQQLIDQNSEVN